MAVPQSFPAKIYQILENESSDIIRWNNDGCSFRIVDHGRFEREIVPKYFRHNQISSVQRQLNLYGFKCISRGELRRSFFHPRFKKGEWEVVKKLTRYIPPKKASPFQDSNFAYDNNGQMPRPTDMSMKNPAVQQQYNNFAGLPYENDNSKVALPVDATPRDTKPSELAMRLGFRHASTDAQNPVSGVMTADSNTNLPPPQQESQLPAAPSFENDFELIKEFDFFDNFADFDFQCEQDTAKSVNPPTTVPSGPISCKPEKVIVFPVRSAPIAASKTTCDVSCMTDLVYSEKHGGFIYM